MENLGHLSEAFHSAASGPDYPFETQELADAANYSHCRVSCASPKRVIITTEVGFVASDRTQCRIKFPALTTPDFRNTNESREKRGCGAILPAMPISVLLW
jgi:hypothetical protein